MQTALVTGATRGIGYATAEALLRAGHEVFITGRHQDQVDAAVRALGVQTGAPTRVAGGAMDVRDRGAADRMVAETVARFGRLTVLVNNAGVGHFASIEATSDADWASVIDTNLTGVFYATRAAIPAIRAAGGGWIINMASLAGRNYFANAAAYCASKAGLVAFSEALMLEVRQFDIRVSVIMPGSVATDFSGPSAKAEDESWKLSSDDIAQVVADLLRHPGRSLPSKIEIRPSRPR
jgi:NAD(P)-dependent dehydrogenase (short-subunit alcohol dehydrogenase family)